MAHRHAGECDCFVSERKVCQSRAVPSDAVVDALNLIAAATITVAVVTWVIYFALRHWKGQNAGELMLLVTSTCSLLSAVAAIATTKAGYGFFSSMF